MNWNTSIDYVSLHYSDNPSALLVLISWTHHICSKREIDMCQPPWPRTLKKTRSFQFKKGVMLQFPSLIPFLVSILISTGGTLFLYLSSFHQNLLIHMPLFHFLHSLMHSLQNFLFNKHSLKAIPSFTIKYSQVGYLSPSLDLNVS